MSDSTRSRLSRKVRNLFIGGLVVVVPIVLTVNALVWLFRLLDGVAQPFTVALLGRTLPGVGFVTTVGVVLLAGFLFSFGPLRRFLDGLDQVLDAVPVVGLVYGTTKKVLSGIGGPGSEHAFKRFVLARLPGRTTPGFLTGTFTLRPKDGLERELCTVYVPTNHLYVGDVVVLPAEDVMETDLSVEDGMSLMLSAGASVPRVVRQRAGWRQPLEPPPAPALQVLHPPELSDVVGDDAQPTRERVSGNQHVIRADGGANRLEPSPHPPVGRGRPEVEVEALDLVKQSVDARMVRPPTNAVVGSVPKLRNDHGGQTQVFR
jgi:uncharacterized membrane protein